MENDPDELIYTFFDEDGPIRLTEQELCNDYMRLRELEALAAARPDAPADERSRSDYEAFGG